MIMTMMMMMMMMNSSTKIESRDRASRDHGDAERKGEFFDGISIEIFTQSLKIL